MNSTPVTTIESLSKFGPWDDKSGMPKLYSTLSTTQIYQAAFRFTYGAHDVSFILVLNIK